MLLCGVRTFLSPPRAGNDKAVCGANIDFLLKLKLIFEIAIEFWSYFPLSVTNEVH
jgi:hypothetical protein